MGKNLEINSELEKYIEDLSYNLHPIQQEIIKYNDSHIITVINVFPQKNPLTQHLSL